MKISGRAIITPPIKPAKNGGLIFTIRSGRDRHMARTNDAAIIDQIQAAAIAGQPVAVAGELHSYRQKDGAKTFILITSID